MRRLAALSVVLALVAAPPAAAAQPAKIARIGVLSGGSAAPSPLLDAFRQSLRDLGYLEGKTILIEYRFADAKPDRLPALAAELVRLGVDVIVAVNTPASQAAKAATRTIPIVFTWVVDPLSLVASLARPGGNITGLTTMSGDLGPKRLEILAETLPGLTRAAVLWNAGNPTATRFFRDMESAAPQLGIRLQALGVRGAEADDVQNAVDAAARDRAGVLFVIEETMLLAHRTLILDSATKLPQPLQHRALARDPGRQPVPAGAERPAPGRGNRAPDRCEGSPRDRPDVACGCLERRHLVRCQAAVRRARRYRLPNRGDLRC